MMMYCLMIMIMILAFQARALIFDMLSEAVWIEGRAGTEKNTMIRVSAVLNEEVERTEGPE